MMLQGHDAEGPDAGDEGEPNEELYGEDAEPHDDMEGMGEMDDEAGFAGEAAGGMDGD